MQVRDHQRSPLIWYYLELNKIYYLKWYFPPSPSDYFALRHPRILSPVLLYSWKIIRMISVFLFLLLLRNSWRRLYKEEQEKNFCLHSMETLFQCILFEFCESSGFFFSSHSLSFVFFLHFKHKLSVVRTYINCLSPRKSWMDIIICCLFAVDQLLMAAGPDDRVLIRPRFLRLSQMVSAVNLLI